MQQRRIVVIGGGAGTDMLLAGLKRYNTRLTALISTFDSSSRHHEGGCKPGYLAEFDVIGEAGNQRRLKVQGGKISGGEPSEGTSRSRIISGARRLP